jgi:plastocyanin
MNCIMYKLNAARINTSEILKAQIALLAIPLFVFVSVLVFPHVSYAQTPNVEITLYGKEYGFGYTETSINSPGPTITFAEGDVVNVTFYNVGATNHGWELVTARSGGTELFSAYIAPIAPGTHASVVFTVTQTGSFYYICPVAGHADLGMWGQVNVNVIPEYPSTSIFVVLIIASTLTAILYAKTRKPQFSVNA